MSDRERVARYLIGLTRRERALLLARGVGQSAVVIALGLCFALFAAHQGWGRENALFCLMVLAGCSFWGLAIRPLSVNWRASGDLVAQARRVEAQEHSLRGRLVAVAERRAGILAGESASIVDRMASRALVVASQVPKRRVHSSGSALRWGALGGGLMGLALVTLLFSPMGLVGTWNWWTASPTALAAVDGPAATGPRARVGDLVLRYVYPEYTGLEPKEIENSTGDVKAPPGTRVEVSARSAEVIESVAVIAYEDEALEGRIAEDGRVISGSFEVGAESGFWRFVTYRAGESKPSRDFKIEPEKDLPPEVVLEASADRVELGVGDPLPLLWRARDDYGIQKVVIHVDGGERGAALAAPRERRAELMGQEAPSPRDLGLSPGDRVKLSVVAWDNDAVSGSKPGESRSIEVVVLGASGLDRRADQRQRDLRDALVDLLATSLVEPWPPGRKEGELSSWGASLVLRYRPVSDWADAWGDQAPRGAQERLERDLVGRVMDSGRALIRFTQVSFPIKSSTLANEEDVRTLSSLREDAIVALENAILALDRMIQNRAMEAVAEAAERLEQRAAEVRAELESMSAQQMLSRLDQLERELAKLMENASRMSDSGLKEFVNQRGQELSQLSAEIRKALAEGREEEARELMERLAREMEDLGKGIREQFERGQQEGSEQAEKAQSLSKKLKELEQKQRDLQEETKKLREKGDTKAAEKAEGLWKQLDRLAGEHVASANQYSEATEKAGRPFHEVEVTRGAEDQAIHLRDAIQARDVRGARRGVEDARAAWDAAEWTLQMEGRMAARPGGRDLEALRRQLDEIDKLLDQLESSSQVPPETQRQVRDLQQKQEALEQELKQAQKDAQEVAQGMQSAPEGMQEGLQEAGDAMEQAGEDLGQGQPMQAEGSQGNAADRIKEARESLEQAMRDERAMNQGSKGGQGESEGSEKGDGTESMQPQPVEIPSPEQFRTPEEYRRELLEGMEGDVPEEYRAMKKRFFEELVNQ